MPEENDLATVARRVIDRRGALRLFASVGVAGAAVPLLSACSTQSTPSAVAQTLRIGLIVPRSGPLQEVGFEMLNGFNLYLTQVNHTLSGATVAVNTIDEGATTASGIAAVRSALKSGSYDVLVGIANSDVLAAVAGDVTTAKIPVVGTNGSPASMPTSVFVWRTSFVAGEASRALADHLLGSPPGKSTKTQVRRPSSVVVYHDSSSDAVAEAKAFIDTLGSESITINVVTTSNLTSAMNQIQSWQADLVFAAVAAPAGPAFTAAYRKAGIDTVLCGPGSLTEQSKQAASASGTFTSMNYGPGLINMANQTFTSEYLSSYQDQVPTTYAMTTYDAGAVLAAAIAKINGDLTPQALNTALGSQLAFDSPRGRWQFNQGRTPLQVWYLRQVRTDGTVLDNTVLAELEALT